MTSAEQRVDEIIASYPEAQRKHFNVANITRDHERADALVSILEFLDIEAQNECCEFSGFALHVETDTGYIIAGPDAEQRCYALFVHRYHNDDERDDCTYLSDAPGTCDIVVSDIELDDDNSTLKLLALLLQTEKTEQVS
jgi:hypothetical protein